MYDSGGFGVTIAPDGGIGDVGGRTEVVYGLIVNHYDPFGNTPRSYLRDGRTPASVTMQDATNDLIAQIRQSSPHLRVISGSGQQLRLDGRTAIAASLRGTNPNTRISERVTVVTRALPDGHLMYVLFVTPVGRVLLVDRVAPSSLDCMIPPAPVKNIRPSTSSMPMRS